MKSLEFVADFISEFDVNFCDFDGLIKESVQFKAEDYSALFNRQGI